MTVNNKGFGLSYNVISLLFEVCAVTDRVRFVRKKNFCRFLLKSPAVFSLKTNQNKWTCYSVTVLCYHTNNEMVSASVTHTRVLIRSCQIFRFPFGRNCTTDKCINVCLTVSVVSISASTGGIFVCG